MNGIINILKPPNMTSHDVVSAMRRLTNIKKIGHTGTLDPMASGVLPICIGKGTKLIEYMENDNKSYRCEMKLGSSTDTQDRWGKILKRYDHIPNQDIIKEVLMSFIGEIEQVPPMYSALKVNGKKLYELAREGIEVERKSRKRTIYKIDIINSEFDKILFDVVCSKGTYIRTLCNDVGEKLKCGGHMSFLLRTSSGSFTLNSAYSLEEIRTSNNMEDFLITPEKFLLKFPKINVPIKFKKEILNGVKINLQDFIDKSISDEIIFSVYLDNKLIGTGKRKKNGIYLDKMLV